MNKNIKIATIVFLGLISLSIIVYVLFFLPNISKKKNISKPIEEYLTQDSKETRLEDLITEDFFREQKNAGVNREYLEEAVSDYKTTSKIIKIQTVRDLADKAETKVEVENTTVNTKTGFTSTSNDFYKVIIKKIENKWKIESIEYLTSE